MLKMEGWLNYVISLFYLDYWLLCSKSQKTKNVMLLQNLIIALHLQSAQTKLELISCYSKNHLFKPIEVLYEN